MFDKQPNQPVLKTICDVKLQMLALYGFFYQRFLLFGVVISFIVYLCLATSFKTLITPVFYVSFRRHWPWIIICLLIWKKSITQKVNKSWLFPKQVISITYENDLCVMLTFSRQMAALRLSSSLATRLILVSILFSSTSKAHG